MIPLKINLSLKLITLRMILLQDALIVAKWIILTFIIMAKVFIHIQE